ncbi:MAG: NAD-dependent epimerase/dehydratase family protein [Spirochaetales bacterium]
MAQSFSLLSHAQKQEFPRSPTVAVTGAAGRIGSYFAEHSAKRYKLILVEHPEVTVPEELARLGEVRSADLVNINEVRDGLAGADIVLHLGAIPSASANWKELLPNNIVATRNAFAAAHEIGAKRLIFASSIHAVSGYPTDYQVHPDDPVNPADLYGVTKAFGEAMGRFYAEQHGLSVIAVRIAAFQPPERAKQVDAVRLMRAFVSDRDLTQLFHRAIDNTTLRFAILHGVSKNHFNRMDIGLAEELLGYEPQDDLTRMNPQLAGLDLPRESRA